MSAIKEIAEKVQKWRRYRASIRELSRLTDRELADVGISRAEIDHIAKVAGR